ncbi:hypothetical protein PLEOSDRAFT_163636 [Pleurotus ostreatus PC15]|uniref:Uncharacterized protein n=2 Tax=Pleurotus TaxID=5320 RepID=A0A067N709_PLEO1|nr:hypothetical protein CCMSSC00406_0003016 [Pleurotus cornucopiae]KDQ22745.1 hypothetical protein PLEOSDRAFT_163636 [Pleurotus ostreatus PC15]
MSTPLSATILISSGISSTEISAVSSTYTVLPDDVKTRGNVLAAAIAVAAVGMLIVGICVLILFIAMRRHKKQKDGFRIDLEQPTNAEATISGPLDLQKGGLRTLTLAHRAMVATGPTSKPPKQTSKDVGLRELVLPELAKSRKTSRSNNVEEARRSGRTQLPLATVSKPFPSYQGGSLS